VGEREGGGGPLEGMGPGKSHKTNNMQYRMQNIEYRILNTAAAKLMYIKLPMYLWDKRRRNYVKQSSINFDLWLNLYFRLSLTYCCSAQIM
jgi:hypothetical protein